MYFENIIKDKLTSLENNASNFVICNKIISKLVLIKKHKIASYIKFICITTLLNPLLYNFQVLFNVSLTVMSLFQLII